MLRVVLIDPSPALRRRLREALTERFAVAVVGEFDLASEALAAMSRDPPDVVILDVNFKRGHGLEVLQHAKRLWPAMRVIAFSNDLAAAYRERYARAGADCCFDKTTEVDRLIERVGALTEPK